MEEKDPSAAQVASSLINTFRKKFLNIQHAVHPTGLPGEAQGKSSNISWAARKASEKYRVNPKRTDTILTVVDGMDVESHISLCTQILTMLCSSRYAPIPELLYPSIELAYRRFGNVFDFPLRSTNHIRQKRLQSTCFGPHGRPSLVWCFSLRHIPGLQDLHPYLGILSTITSS